MPRFYARYMTLIEQCRAGGSDAGNRWLARDVDLALWILGGKLATAYLRAVLHVPVSGTDGRSVRG
jgi:hypothetical protein